MTQRIFLLLASCFLSCISLAQSQVALIPFLKGNLWGFADINGTLKIPALYDSVSLFSADYSFSENKMTHCSVVIRNGKYGIIDEFNNILVSPIYKKMEEQYMDANHKLFIVQDSSGKFGLLGLHDTILQPEYDLITRIESDYFLLQRNGKLGVANTQGDIIVPVAQDNIKQMSENSSEVEWKAVNASETSILKTTPVRNRNRYGSGEVVVESSDAFVTTGKNEKTYDYKTELAALKAKYAVFCVGYDKNICYCMKDGKMGYANIRNNKRIPPIYDQVQVGYVDFNENLVIVKLGGMYGLADEDGKILAPVKYKYISVSPYKTGVFSIESSDGHYGFYFPHTEKLVHPKYLKVMEGESVYTNVQKYEEFDIMYVSDGKTSFFVGENGIEFRQ